MFVSAVDGACVAVTVAGFFFSVFHLFFTAEKINMSNVSVCTCVRQFGNIRVYFCLGRCELLRLHIQ